MTTPESTSDETIQGTDVKTSTQTESDSNPARDATHDSVDAATRKEVLAEYDYRCQICGRRDPEHGGLATLQVHHIEREPDGMDEHDPENLTVFCRACHTWIHNRSTIADSPVELSAADRSNLLPQDIEILEYLEAHGPARTGDIAEAISIDLTVTALRERLWTLMGLDNAVESRDSQLIDKDVETNEWGLPEQIETSSRGHIPDDTQTLLQRMEDEQVRQALERGCSRDDVAAVLNTTRRTTFSKEKRARALDFPLDAFSRGRPPTSSPANSDDLHRDGESADTEADRPMAENTAESVAPSPKASDESQHTQESKAAETPDEEKTADAESHHHDQAQVVPQWLVRRSQSTDKDKGQEDSSESVRISGIVITGP